MDTRHKRIYEFGAYRIDSLNRLVVRDGRPVPLKAKVVDTLLILLERAGNVVAKEELMRQLWPDTFVEEGNLTQNIYVLRRALDDAEHIETIPRRGYRFVTPVRAWDETATAEAPLIEPARATGVRSYWPVTVAAVLAVVIGAAVWTWRGVPAASTLSLARMTTAGNVVRAAMSRDGRYVALVVAEAGRQSLRLRQVETGKDLELVASEAVDFYGLTYAPDGNFIYYVSQEFSKVGKLFRVPALGGPASKLVEDVDSPVTLSPDGARLAFIRYTPGEASIVVANADGSGERRLSTTKLGDEIQIAPTVLIAPAWSPDGATIACAVGISTQETEYQSIRAFDATTGVGKPLTDEHWQTLGRLEWIRDGSGLLVLAAEPGAALSQQIWLVDRSGAARRMTNDLQDYRDLSLGSSAGIAIQTERRANIWIAPVGNEADGRQVTATNYDGLGGIGWFPDGRIVYTQQSGAELDLWVKDPTASQAHPLVQHAGVNRQPIISPDSRYVVFVSNRSGREHLWRVDADGTHATELTRGDSDVDPTFTADGKAVIYRRMASGRGYLHRVSIDGGEPVQITDKPAGDPAVSPDGNLLVVYHRPTPTSTVNLTTLSVNGGELRAIRVLPGHFGRFRWTPDGRSVAWSARFQGLGNIWAQPIDGAESQALTHWGSDPVFFFEWSRDGKWLAYAKGSITSDAVRITLTRRSGN